MATAMPLSHRSASDADLSLADPGSAPRSRVTEIPSFSLLGKNVFVTGGSRGIGRACALMLAAAGADVAVGSRPLGGGVAERGCDEIRDKGRRARAYPCDIGERGAVETMCARVTEDFGTIDILVNNAGVTR